MNWPMARSHNVKRREQAFSLEKRHIKTLHYYNIIHLFGWGWVEQGRSRLGMTDSSMCGSSPVWNGVLVSALIRGPGFRDVQGQVPRSPW
jgi:hypothetical protein